MSDGKEPVFLVLKLIIAALLEMLCLGLYVSAKLLLCPNSLQADFPASCGLVISSRH